MEKDTVTKKNLFFAVEQIRKKEEYVRSYLRGHPEESVIVFCATRRIADTLWKNLSTEGFPAARYHEGMTEKRRLLEMETFAGDRSRVMITTGASGMETEKKNIRFVIHYNMPLSPEDYCREAGYAGRDNETAECIILFSRQDIAIDRMLLRNRRNDGRFTEEEWDSLRRADETRMQKMIAYCTEDHCFRAGMWVFNHSYLESNQSFAFLQLFATVVCPECHLWLSRTMEASRALASAEEA